MRKLDITYEDGFLEAIYQTDTGFTILSGEIEIEDAATVYNIPRYTIRGDATLNQVQRFERRDIQEEDFFECDLWKLVKPFRHLLTETKESLQTT